MKFLRFARFLAVLGMTVGLFFSVSQTNAQAIRYPITDLGNCRDAKECYLYCEVPTNKPACWAHRVYVINQQVLGEETSASTKFPIEELGNCADTASCRAFCENPENKISCHEFAQKNNLGKFRKQKAALEKAQQEFGCPTVAACKLFCQSEANFEKCLNFAKSLKPKEEQEKHGKLLEQAKKILGCDTIDSCRAFCHNPENKEKCHQLVSSESAKIKPSIIKRETPKKLGCSTEAECRKVCEEHPDQCPAFKKVLERKNSTPSFKLKPSVFPKEKILRPTLAQDEQDKSACNQEAKICQDGTSVGRSGPHCEFAPCPIK